MKRWLCASLALIFYMYILPWAGADYFNYRAHDIASDGGNISGFDNGVFTGYVYDNNIINYWKSSLAELNAITGVTNADKAVVIASDNSVTFYTHTSGAWTIAASIDNSIVNAKLPPFNAKGDGSTDDTVALKAAIAVCKATRSTLTVPAGNYRISSKLDLTGMSLHGAGSAMYGTSFNLLSGFTDNEAILIDGGTTGTGEFLHQSFRVAGDQASGTIAGVRISGLVFPGIFQDIRVEHMGGDGWLINGTSGYVPELITFIGTRTENGLGNGITITEGRSLTFINPIWEGVAKTGLNLAGTGNNVSNIQIINPWIEGVATTSGHGVYLNNTDSVTISNLKLSAYGAGGGPASHGIFLDTAYRTKIDAADISSVTAGSSYKTKIASGYRNTFERMPSNFNDNDVYALDSQVYFIKSVTVLPNSKGQIFISNGSSIDNGSTLYLGPPLGLGNADPDMYKMLISGYVHALELRVECTPPAAGQTYTVTVVKGTTPTDLTVTLTNGAPSAVNSSNEVMFRPGDYISFKVVTSGTAGSINAGRLKITLGYLQ